MKAFARPSPRPLLPACALALFLVACGDERGGAKDAPGALPSVAVADVDPHDPIAVEKALASLGYTPVELLAEDFEVDRAGAPVVSLLYPRGEVRKAGLRTYRIDVLLAQFDGDATLSFASRGKTLYEAPFVPAKSVRAPIPPAVLARVDAGDKVTWGLAMKGTRKREHMTTFEVVPAKPAVEKKLARIDADAHFEASPLLRELERARVLGDYQLDAEVVEILTQVAEKDPAFVSVHADILRSMRRLRLQEAPLFRDEQRRAIGIRGLVRPGTGAPLDSPKPEGLAGGPARDSQPAVPAPGMAPLGAGGGVAGRPVGGAVPPERDAAPAPEDPPAAGTTPSPSPLRVRAERVLAEIRQAEGERVLVADKAEEAARVAESDAADAARRAGEAAKAAEKARREAGGFPEGALERQAAEKAAARAAAEADKARLDAEAKRGDATEKAQRAERARKAAADAGAVAKLLPAAGDPPPSGAPDRPGPGQVDALRTISEALAKQADAARAQALAAKAALEAARAALEAAAGDSVKAPAAGEDVERKRRALDEATGEVERLERVTREALDVAGKDPTVR